MLRLPRVAIACLTVATLDLTAPLALHAQAAPGANTAGQAANTLPLKTARTHTFTTTKGTWISLDVSPDGKTIVFIEVKSRRTLTYGVPQLAVTPFKQRQISKAALTWLSKKRLHDSPARFDVIAILLNNDYSHQVEHIRNAFDLAY